MQSKKDFDPNSAAVEGAGIFGLPDSDAESSELILIPVPWDATTSYGEGTSRGPDSILKASHQLDLYDRTWGPIYTHGIHMLPMDDEVRAWNAQARSAARATHDCDRVNELSAKLNQWVETQTSHWIAKGKTVGIVGGDHAVPWGAIRAAAQAHGDFGILHFDAHHDLRRAYEGFDWSHASIFFNVMEHIPQVKKLVQVGIRDFCEQEHQYAESLKHRARVFYDRDFAAWKFSGKSFSAWTEEVLKNLPSKLWISFDIDALDPSVCPGTGTPVPGGFTYHEAVYMIQALKDRQVEILGFDLCEVGAEEWDGNVGMRLLYQLCGISLNQRHRKPV